MGDISIADVTSAESTKPRKFELADEAGYGAHVLAHASGLTIKVLPGGFLYSIEHGEIFINQVLASPLAGGIHRIYLRVFEDGVFRTCQITGDCPDAEFNASAEGFLWNGSCLGVSYTCYCWLPPRGDSWVFQLEITNVSEKTLLCDAILVQDIGLATRGHVRNNERYTSQYLDHHAVPHEKFGHFLMTRQNLAQIDGTHPWLLQGCFPRMAGLTTDGFDFFGVGFRATGKPSALSLPLIGTQIRQYEAGYTAIQSSPVELPPGKSHSYAFFSYFSADHPNPSSAADIDDRQLSELQELCRSAAKKRANPLLRPAQSRPRTLFQTAPLFVAIDLDEKEIHRLFPGDYRHEEFEGAQRHSFFCGDNSRHIALKSKEISLLRSHGHILRSGQGFMPDAEVMSCTCYAPGVFASQMALGNTVFGKLLSGLRDPLNIVRTSGLRIFLRQQPTAMWELLGVPSAFEMAQNFCRWYYKSDRDLLTVTCRTSDEDAALTYSVSSRDFPVELLFCGEISAGPQEYDSAPELTIDVRRTRMTIRPDRRSLVAQQQPELTFHVVNSTPHAVDALGGDELICPSATSPSLPYFAIRTHPTTRFSLSFLGTFDNIWRTETLCSKYESLGAASPNDDAESTAFWTDINARLPVFSPAPGQPQTDAISQLQDASIWMAHNAVIHLSVPRGLEQANGGAWGVRDVCQGPVEFLLSQDRPAIVKAVLQKLFSQQYRQTGDWPQWFMFAPFQQVQSKTSHGDILIWPLKALCDYLEHTNDGDILDENLPYTDCEMFEPDQPSESILKHVDTLIARIEHRCLAGLSLPSYGEGDWDDSLQPVSEGLAKRMVSSWTVALLYQTLRRYAVALDRFGQAERAGAVTAFADRIHTDFHKYLMPAGIVCGFAVFGSEPGQVDHYLLHPLDQRTGLHYRLISMTRGILSGIFTADQAKYHLELVKKYLLYPDGARLIDRPTTYRGGVESIFRRSESAAFFGREIGLQYVHAHLRYAEALAALGESEELLPALMMVNPVAVTDVVRNALPRQRNSYFSSSDAAFKERYEASRDYEKLREGQISVEGGWRIYSSGPGIFSNLVIRHFLGIRKFYDCVDLDPIIPAELSGICWDLAYCGRKVRYEFKRAAGGAGVQRVIVNGVDVQILSSTNGHYGARGARLKKTELEAMLTLPENKIQIEL